MADLTGKVAIVTGSSGGIGRSIAEALLGRGASVVVSSRSGQAVSATVSELRDAIGDDERVVGVVCDVTDSDACRELVGACVARFRRLDILVNNAGIGIFKPVAELGVEEWRRVLATNLDGVFYCSHFALPHLIRSDDAWIINIASLAGKNAFPGGSAYNASKFGLVGFSEAMMQDVRHDGVRVSYIMPGSVATEFGEGRGGDWKIQPEDVAAVVLDLLDTPARVIASRIEMRPSRPPR
jgi:3-oxoacyl-[acyl-carrier protein] reductase